MKTLTSLFAVCILTAPAMAQAVSEPFDYSTTALFPPAGWTTTNSTGGIYAGWEEPVLMTTSNNMSTLISDAAGHDDFGGSATNDNTIDAPTMDLSSYPGAQLAFDSEVFYYIYMAHAIGSFGNGTSNVELSTDGGVTWASEWTETAQSDGYYPGQAADLSAYNTSGVEMRFHYFGDYAHCWAIDNVVVDSPAPAGPALSMTGTCPGAMTAHATNMTVGGPVVFAWGFAGSYTVPGGPCAGLTVPMASPNQLGTVPADSTGHALLSGNAPANGCGTVWVVAVDGATCTASNTVGI